MKVGYLGPSGTYCQEAVEILAASMGECMQVEYPTIYDALNHVQSKEVDCAVVPIENSIEGSVNVTLDILAESIELKIKGEIILPVRHCLLARKETLRHDIKLILSHPQALAQCSKFLQAEFSGVETRYTLSTAEGAKQVAQSQEKWAAIANPKAGEVYNLVQICKGIQDDINNATRFVVVALEDSERTSSYDKTSIVFSTEDKPGSLYRVLDIFNLWGINLTRIESRPAKNQLGRYIFFVDIEGHKGEPDIRDALTMVDRKTSFFRLLGSYPRLN